MSKRRNKRKQIIISVLIILLILIGFGAIKLNSLFNQMEQVDLDDEDLGLQVYMNNVPDTGVINIALFGIDTRNNDYSNSLSDSIIIASIDFDHNALKLTSIMRDTYAYIPGLGYGKINSAYNNGGPSLAIKAINTNFDMNITDFVSVNFEAMEKIIDSVDGVEIEVKDYEINELNRVIAELDDFLGGSTELITEEGIQTLHGRQAVAYSRIRKVGHGDYERTQRQRIVLEQIIDKVLKGGSINQIVNFADTLLPYVQTSLSQGEILSIAAQVLTKRTTTLIDTRLPLDDYVENTYVGSASVVLPRTLLDNVKYLHNFIYENDDYEPSERLLEINNTIKSYE